LDNVHVLISNFDLFDPSKIFDISKIKFFGLIDSQALRLRVWRTTKSFYWTRQDAEQWHVILSIEPVRLKMCCTYIADIPARAAFRDELCEKYKRPAISVALCQIQLLRS
jgi:hypothetical protein